MKSSIRVLAWVFIKCMFKLFTSQAWDILKEFNILDNSLCEISEKENCWSVFGGTGRIGEAKNLEDSSCTDGMKYSLNELAIFSWSVRRVPFIVICKLLLFFKIFSPVIDLIVCHSALGLVAAWLIWFWK